MSETIKLTDAAQKELEGIVKEKTQEIEKSLRAEIEQKALEEQERNAKALEALPELKATIQDLQGKLVTAKQKTGTNTYMFKGFNPELSKNFRSTVSNEEVEIFSKAAVQMIKDGREGSIFQTMDKAFDGSAALGVQYGSAVMGLAEYNSVALQEADVIVAEDPTIKLPVKSTRDTVDAQTPGTANTVGTSAISQITWTIDKVVGNYLELLTTQIEDAKFDIVNTIIIPFQGEAMGQNYDNEMFNGTEYTTSISDATASVEYTAASGTAVTFANLLTMYDALSWSRGISNPKWYGPQGVYRDVMALAGSTNDHPIFLESLTAKPVKQILGSEYVVTPAISNTPAIGSIRMAFGDASHYRIFVRGGTFQTMVNPYIKMKEGYVQFICRSRSDGNISDNATAASSGAWTTMKRTA